jgi:hypothetical protein
MTLHGTSGYPDLYVLRAVQRVLAQLPDKSSPPIREPDLSEEPS